MSTPLEQLGQRVATCRQQAGLDVATLSQRARVPEAQLREFERGNGGLALAALSRLARVLGVPTGTFLHTDAPAARAYKLSSVLQQADSTFIHRVRLENYKSIATCDVALGPLTFLVGLNGAGKSNFLDALRLVAEALRTSLDHALRERGGLGQVLRRSEEPPAHFVIQFDFNLPGGRQGHYALKVGATQGGYEVQAEECTVDGGAWYRVQAGVPTGSFQPLPVAAPDRLYFVTVSGLPEFRAAYELLSRMGFYSFNPECIRDLQVPGMGDMLARDGHNLASVLGQLESRAPELKQRLEEYLSQVVPGFQSVRTERLGPKETLQFTLEARGASARHFLAASMSDGTLRALGVLVALFQPMVDSQRWVPLVAIEEPELTLHPSAAAVLCEALQECSQQRQVLITSHSPDLLDQKSLTEDEVLAVVAEHGETRIGRLDVAGCSALRERIYTAGELLRGNQLWPGELSLGRYRAESEGLHQEAREIVDGEVAVQAHVAADERLDVVSRVQEERDCVGARVAVGVGVLSAPGVTFVGAIMLDVDVHIVQCAAVIGVLRRRDSEGVQARAGGYEGTPPGHPACIHVGVGGLIPQECLATRGVVVGPCHTEGDDTRRGTGEGGLGVACIRGGAEGDGKASSEFQETQHFLLLLQVLRPVSSWCQMA